MSEGLRLLTSHTFIHIRWAYSQEFPSPHLPKLHQHFETHHAAALRTALRTVRSSWPPNGSRCPSQRDIPASPRAARTRQSSPGPERIGTGEHRVVSHMGRWERRVGKVGRVQSCFHGLDEKDGKGICYGGIYCWSVPELRSHELLMISWQL